MATSTTAGSSAPSCPNAMSPGPGSLAVVGGVAAEPAAWKESLAATAHPVWVDTAGTTRPTTPAERACGARKAGPPSCYFPALEPPTTAWEWGPLVAATR